MKLDNCLTAISAAAMFEDCLTVIAAAVMFGNCLTVVTKVVMFGNCFTVVPAKAGTQRRSALKPLGRGLRRGDGR
jgi:hypothetical protein